jgi:hypothetical protein
LNALDKDADGKFILDFLRVYSRGGVYVADEGRVSDNAGYVLRWLVEASLQEEIDLGDYHPGLQGITVKKHPQFRLAITQNYHFRTEGRQALSIGLDRESGKIRVDNILSFADALALINYYLEDALVPAQEKEALARLHIRLSQAHPQKRMISPRDLIEVALRIKQAPQDENALYEQLGICYLEGLLSQKERQEAAAMIREFFPDYRQPGYTEIQFDRQAGSNVDEPEVAHWQHSPTMVAGAKALKSMLSLGGRQVLLNQEQGGFALDLVKLLCQQEGRQLLVMEGHPFVTAKQLLEGESFVFEPQFDARGKRLANSAGYVLTRGFIGRHLVKLDEYDASAAGDKQQVIIAITNIEAIPESELVKLNRLLATGTTLMRDETGRLCEYVLPADVHIVAITAEMDKLSSPFANRFKKLAAPFIQDNAEMHRVLQALYPAGSGIYPAACPGRSRLFSGGPF